MSNLVATKMLLNTSLSVIDPPPVLHVTLKVMLGGNNLEEADWHMG